MRVIIAGSRYFDDYGKLSRVVLAVFAHVGVDLDSVEVVSGCCQGADLLGERLAAEHGWPVRQFPANWGKYGRAAGPIRNAQMADYADMCIVFPVAGISCRGTRDMVRVARSRGLLVFAAS